jgi:hypothetical protein
LLWTVITVHISAEHTSGFKAGRGDHPQTAVNSIQGERAHTNMIYPFLLDTEEFLFVVQLVEEKSFVVVIIGPRLG